MRHEEQIKQGFKQTLDEPVKETILRDMRQVADKLKIVLMPISKDSSANIVQKLKEYLFLWLVLRYIFLCNYIAHENQNKWDLWGPLIVCLLLSSLLSITAPPETASMVFAAVFVIVWFGSVAVTLNAQLLGGSISFFQSVCILGYCVFPLTLSAFTAAIVSLLYKSLVIKLIIVGVGFLWSTRASVVFMSEMISENRRALAVYPVFFFYTFIAWMILLQ